MSMPLEGAPEISAEDYFSDNTDEVTQPVDKGTQEDDPNDEDNSEEDESDEDESDDTGDEDEGDEEDGLILGKFKTQEDLEKSYSHLESYASRTINELKQEADRREAAAEARFQQMLEQIKPQQNPYQQYGQAEQLTNFALNDPRNAYVAALDSGDPRQVAHVIGTVAGGDLELGLEGNARLAEEMRLDYQQFQLEQMQQQAQQQISSVNASSIMTQAKTDFERLHPDYMELQEYMKPYVQEALPTTDLTDYNSVSKLLNNAYKAAVGEAAIAGKFIAPGAKSAEEQAASRGKKIRGTVESGTRGKAPTPKKPTLEDEYGDDLIAASKGRSYF